MAENNLLPIEQSQPHDIFLCGFPRSGHTWFQNLMAGAVFGFDPEFAHDTLIQDLIPDVHYKTHYKRYGATAYFKTHQLPDPRIRRVVYLLRDGRDAMTSYHHFLQALQVAPTFLELVQSEHISPCPWQQHVNAWLDNPYGADQLVIRYEDLHAASLRELERFCEFAGLQRDQEHLERIIRKGSFAQAQMKERTQGWENPAWPKDKPFVRRGRIGSYQDEMPADVQQAFLARAGETLARCGYLDASVCKVA